MTIQQTKIEGIRLGLEYKQIKKEGTGTEGIKYMKKN